MLIATLFSSMGAELFSSMGAELFSSMGAELFSSMGAELFSILYRPRLVYTCFESSAPFKKASQYITLLHTYE